MTIFDGVNMAGMDPEISAAFVALGSAVEALTAKIVAAPAGPSIEDLAQQLGGEMGPFFDQVLTALDDAVAARKAEADRADALSRAITDLKRKYRDIEADDPVKQQAMIETVAAFVEGL